MRVSWTSNHFMQPTGYGTIARNILPILQEKSDHNFVHFAISGASRLMPHKNKEWADIPIYSKSSYGGNFGENDWKVVDKKESVDMWLMNFDMWGISNQVEKIGVKYALYPPVDQDPMSPLWQAPMKEASEIVPYCDFGERVIKESPLEGMDKVKEPIYHGVDTDVYHPKDVSKKEVLGVPEDTFVAGVFKNNQGTRFKPVRQMRGFKQFIQKLGKIAPNKKVLLYLHSSIQGKQGAFNIRALISQLGLEGNVMTVNQGDYRFGLDDEDLNDTYNAMDVVMNCTAGEGFGLPILESFATGTPVIATGFSSMSELLNDEEGELMQNEYSNVINAKRGWLVPTWDLEPTTTKYGFRRVPKAEHIADALMEAYQNGGLKSETLRDYAKKYQWEKIADKWADYFDGLEERTFSEDETEEDVIWSKINEEKGGVGAFQS